MPASQLNVAFLPLGAEWQGGKTLVTNAIHALHAAASDQTHIRILGEPGPQTSAYAREAGADGTVAYSAPPAWSPMRVASSLAIRLNQQNVSLGSTLGRAGVQVLVGEGLSWRLGSVATVGWLQDFQHVHLPEYFTADELARRDRKFHHTMHIADRLLAFVSVADDARAFAPDHAHKVRAIHPYSVVDPCIYSRNCNAVVSEYQLPERFFYVPNQLWLHKNHFGLLKALHILRERGTTPHLVLTGGVHDYRDPLLFQKFTRSVEEWKLGDQVHHLGLVDRAHVYDLIRQCICVVTPSLFEGWGYAVDEAAAVGKRVLASDIEAHREQHAPACDLFDPRDLEELATKLEHLWLSAGAGPDLELEEQARHRMPERVHTLGCELFEVLSEAVRAHRGAD